MEIALIILGVLIIVAVLIFVVIRSSNNPTTTNFNSNVMTTAAPTTYSNLMTSAAPIMTSNNLMTTTTLPVGSVPGYSMKYGVDYPGNDILHLDGPLAGCVAACNNLPTCLGFDYASNTNPYPNQCNLKSALPNQGNTSDWNFYTKG